MAFSLVLLGCPSPIGPGYGERSATEVSRQLTFHAGEDFSPAWMPDGRTLVFVSDQQGGWNLSTLDLDAPAPRPLTVGPNQYTSPYVMPDGSGIVVASDRDSPTRAWTDLWVLSVDGSAERRLIEASPAVKEFVPTVSPDGRRLAYLDLPMDRPAQYRLVVYELPNGPARVLTDDRVAFSPIRFTADGNSILFTASVLGSSDVWTIKVNGTGARALTSRPEAELFGDINPEGTRIAFTTNQSGRDEVWVMDAQGLEARQLTFDAATASGPSFSPDGTRIAYTSTRSGNQDIWLISSETTRLR